MTDHPDLVSMHEKYLVHVTDTFYGEATSVRILPAKKKF